MIFREATHPQTSRGRCFHRESMNIALCEKARICQAGFILNPFFKEDFFHGWNGRRVASFCGEAG